MPSNQRDDQQPLNNFIRTRRKLPFDSNSVRMSTSKNSISSSGKRAVSSNYPNTKSNHYQEIFLNKSSSSSSSSNDDIDDDDDGEMKTLEETFLDLDQRKTFTNSHRRSTNATNRTDLGTPMIQELLQSNMDLKKEIRDIRRQIRQQTGSQKKSSHRDRSNRQNVKKNLTLTDDEHDDCSYFPAENLDETTKSNSKLEKYKKEASIYKQQLDSCQETIAQLRKTIDTMDKNLEQLKSVQRPPTHETSSTQKSNPSDHRFIHELFHLCIKYSSRSMKSSSMTPSHHDMKTFIRQTFADLIKSTSSSSSPLKISATKTNLNETNHFICKCSDRVNAEHRPSYQFCLTIIEQCQSLFDIICFTQVPTALNELYYRVGELTNFKRSIASTLGVTENSRLISCPKLVKTLQQLLDDAKSNELISFKRLAKINDMNEAISKIRSYDDFVPYYHQFIEQMANLLEVSKGDEIMPAIKTLKLLAHSDSHRPSSRGSHQESQTLTRASSLTFNRTSYDDYAEKNLVHSKSLRVLSSRSTEQSDKMLDESEKAANSTTATTDQ